MRKLLSLLLSFGLVAPTTGYTQNANDPDDRASLEKKILKLESDIQLANHKLTLIQDYKDQNDRINWLRANDSEWGYALNTTIFAAGVSVVILSRYSKKAARSFVSPYAFVDRTIQTGIGISMAAIGGWNVVSLFILESVDDSKTVKLLDSASDTDRKKMIASMEKTAREIIAVDTKEKKNFMTIQDARFARMTE